jgi:hypothetical protein
MVTSVAARCFSCGYPMPRQFVAPPSKERKGFTAAYVAGSAMVAAGYFLRELWGDTAEEVLITLGVLVVVGSLVARAFMKWMDKPIDP